MKLARSLLVVLSFALVACSVPIVSEPPILQVTHAAATEQAIHPATPTNTPLPPTETPSPTETPDPQKIVATYERVEVVLKPGLTIMTLEDRVNGGMLQSPGPFFFCGVTGDGMLTACGGPDGNEPILIVADPNQVNLDGTGITLP